MPAETCGKPERELSNADQSAVVIPASWQWAIPAHRPCSGGRYRDVVAEVVSHAHPVVLIAVVVKPVRALDICGVAVLRLAS